MPASLGEVLGSYLLFLVILEPIGLTIVIALEEFVLRKPALLAAERWILGLYAAGAVFFGVASLPGKAFGGVLIGVLLASGAAGLLLLLRRFGGGVVRSRLGLFARPVPMALVAGTFGLALLEVVPVWNHGFPNAWDGSVTALWTHLLLRSGSVPSSLSPFSNAPVVYPMGVSVWMALSVQLLGWSPISSPVLLPPLFLALTVPSAYVWGRRWSRDGRIRPEATGLLFAAFFGAVAAWPRFYTGGSYDFALAIPLLLVAWGLLPEFALAGPRPLREVVLLGLLAGALASLSLVAGELLVLTLIAFLLSTHRSAPRDLARWASRAGLVVLLEVTVTARSLAAWLTTPGTQFAPNGFYGPLDWRLVTGELDPFVPWKFKLSPFPAQSVLIQALLVGGLGLLVLRACRTRDRRPDPLSGMARSLGILTVTAFASTAALLLSVLPGKIPSALQGVTNLDQFSVALFVAFEGIALLPLVVALNRLLDSPRTPRPKISDLAGLPLRGRPGPVGDRRAAPPIARRALTTVFLVMLVAFPLAYGVATSIALAPHYLEQNVEKTSNVTLGDLRALEWAGENLPSCSVVLIAPGSAAQFLPEYASLRVDFPMNPVPSNSSYRAAVGDLTAGRYVASTRAALEQLAVTEVFVTGPTSVSYPAFLPGPLLVSGDFAVLFSSGDAVLFAFLPDTSAGPCGA